MSQRWCDACGTPLFCINTATEEVITEQFMIQMSMEARLTPDWAFMLRILSAYFID